jgi:hypothetical protein
VVAKNERVAKMQRILRFLLSGLVGLLVSTNISAGTLKLDSRYSTIKVNADATLAIDQPISVFNGTLIKAFGAGVTGEDITFNDGILEDAGNQLLLSAVLDLSGTIILSGDSSVCAKPGTV